MAGVTFDAVGTAVDSPGGSSSPLDLNLSITVGSGSNRALIVCATFLVAVTSPTAAWDQGGTPQAMTLLANKATVNGQTVCIFGLVNPTSGAKTVRLTWTGGASEVITQAISFTNVNQSGGATSFPNATTLNNQSAAISMSIAGGINNAGVAAFCCGSANQISAVNNTQTYLQHGSGTVEGAGCRTSASDTFYFGATIAGIDQWAAAAVAIVTVNPVISPSLSNLKVNEGENASFTISATGTGVLHYQWKKNGSNVGTDSSTYTISPTALSDDGATISCDVTDDNGTSSSNTVLLKVIPTAKLQWRKA